MPEAPLDEIADEAVSSVDQFIRELEEKERALHITADLQIEIEQSECDARLTPGGLNAVSGESAERVPAQRSDPGLKTRVFELQREVDQLNLRLIQIKAERNDIQEKSDRRLKDFESFKYRMDRERRGAFIDQTANLAGAMLPVLDNLERALGSVDPQKMDGRAEFSRFYDGIALVNQQVNEVLSELGVEPIKTVGERFNPELHEAVATEERPDLPNNSISGEILRGYRIGNRVIRHSMVKVTLGGASPAEAAAKASVPSADKPIESAE